MRIASMKQRRAGALVARCKVEQVHQRGILTFNNLLNVKKYINEFLQF
jgi:hypothetical protein